MDERRRKHGWPLWCIIGATLLVLYLLSLGPVHSLGQHNMYRLPAPIMVAIMLYCWPLDVIDNFGPEWLQSLTWQYLALWL